MCCSLHEILWMCYMRSSDTSDVRRFPGHFARFLVVAHKFTTIEDFLFTCLWFPTYRGSQTGGGFRGLGTSRRRRVIQGLDTSSRPLIGTGARHVKSLTSDRGSTHHVVAVYQGTMTSLRLSVGKFLPSPIQSVVPIPSERFFFLFDSPYSLLSTL
jgi:hypothetical protein